jgi:signal recognition particle subunit SRP68
MAADDDNENGTTTPKEDADTTPPPPLELQLHHMLRSLQLQHGLRHGDYQRYRHYVTRRLARLRKAGKATHKGGKAFATKDVHTLESLGGDPAAVKMEHLLLLLLNAERAWAFAMQVKQDAASNQHMPSYLRAHLLRRLRRAAVWATRLQGLVGEVSGRITERTSLEVAAYAGWMAAGVDVEQEQWARALGKLRTAHSILSQLGEVGSLEEQDLFSSKAEEVLQSARFCQYNLGEGSLEDLKVQGEHVPQALREKLEAVMEASRTEAATGLEAVEWGGRRLPVSSAEVRVALVKVDEARKALLNEEEEEEGKKEGQYASVYAAYDEASKRVAEEAGKLEGMSHGARVEAQKEELRLLASYLQHGKLETMRLRNEGLVKSLLRGNAGGKGGKAGGRPEDLVHVLDSLMQNAAEVQALPGVEELEPVLTQAQALQARYRAQRAFYLAEFYVGGKKLAEALALYEKAEELGEAAVELANEVVGKEEKEGMLKKAREVKEMAAGGKYRTQALAFLASLPPAAAGGAGSEEAALTAALSALSLSAATAATAAAAAAARGEGEGEEGGGKGKKAQQQKKGKKKQSPQQPGKTKTTAGKGASSDGLGAGMAPASRTLLERLGELDGGREASGFGIAHVPPTMTPVRAKPQLFDMAFNFLEGRLPDLAAKAGLPPSKKKGGAGGGAAGGGGLFGWLRG